MSTKAVITVATEVDTPAQLIALQNVIRDAVDGHDADGGMPHKATMHVGVQQNADDVLAVYAADAPAPDPRTAAQRSDDALCGCDRPDEAENPHRHPRDPACALWAQLRPVVADLQVAAASPAPGTVTVQQADLGAVLAACEDRGLVGHANYRLRDALDLARQTTTQKEHP